MQAANDTHGRNTVLIVMGDAEVRRTVADYLRECGSTVLEARDAAEALRLKQLANCDAALTELDLPGPMDGFSLAQAILRKRPGTEVVLTLDAAHAARDAVKLGSILPALGKAFHQFTLAQRLRRVRGQRR
jgi:CheY-like chemotaxis protein